jgi:SAM-dependent methyltransferase
VINAEALGGTAFADTRQGAPALRLRCPMCQTGIQLASAAGDGRCCSSCGFGIREHNGIIRALTPARKARFEQFVREYKVVREQEGWGSIDSGYYLALPFADLTHQHEWIWRIRARTWNYMLKRVLRQANGGRSGVRVLDIGAGNGWLSYRLAQSGYDAVAVDLIDDEVDGLGAARHYFPHLPRAFPRFQAEMDCLPFDSGQFDIAIFNASFHYSFDYEKTLREAMRCVRRSGLVIIADSPCYRRDDSGQRMLDERQKSFQQQFGLRSDSVRNGEYVTPGVLQVLSERLLIRWKLGKPWYGLSWALRPVKARILRRREPSKFYLWWFRVDT